MMDGMVAAERAQDRQPGNWMIWRQMIDKMQPLIGKHIAHGSRDKERGQVALPSHYQGQHHRTGQNKDADNAIEGEEHQTELLDRLHGHGLGGIDPMMDRRMANIKDFHQWDLTHPMMKDIAMSMPLGDIGEQPGNWNRPELPCFDIVNIRQSNPDNPNANHCWSEKMSPGGVPKWDLAYPLFSNPFAVLVFRWQRFKVCQ